MDEQTCASCGETLPRGADLCPACGVEVEGWREDDRRLTLADPTDPSLPQGWRDITRGRPADPRGQSPGPVIDYDDDGVQIIDGVRPADPNHRRPLILAGIAMLIALPLLVLALKGLLEAAHESATRPAPAASAPRTPTAGPSAPRSPAPGASRGPSAPPRATPSAKPSRTPTATPTATPAASASPTPSPTSSPTASPTAAPAPVGLGPGGRVCLPATRRAFGVATDNATTTCGLAESLLANWNDHRGEGLVRQIPAESRATGRTLRMTCRLEEHIARCTGPDAARVVVFDSEAGLL